MDVVHISKNVALDVDRTNMSVWIINTYPDRDPTRVEVSSDELPDLIAQLVKVVADFN